MNEQLSELVGLEEKKIEFYADAETLKQSSGYYTFMNHLPLNPNMWVENCNPCKKAMLKIMLTPNAKVQGIPGTELWEGLSPSYIKDIRFNSSGDFWFCPNCKGIWSSYPGFWLRVTVNDEEFLDIARVKMTEENLQVEAAAAANTPVSLGEKPTPDSTECPHCHVWRNVEPYFSTPEDTQGRMQHVCPKCHTADIKEAEIKEPVSSPEEIS